MELSDKPVVIKEIVWYNNNKEYNQVKKIVTAFGIHADNGIEIESEK